MVLSVWALILIGLVVLAVVGAIVAAVIASTSRGREDDRP
jgi:hypothetical protein